MCDKLKEKTNKLRLMLYGYHLQVKVLNSDVALILQAYEAQLERLNSIFPEDNPHNHHFWWLCKRMQSNTS